ncbi:MAG: UvrD-helicase domain-containing protein, partial [Terrimicrobiaceae bacterium]
MILPPLKNQRIIANAGSGKTYRLVSRYLELLKRGEPAERIIALTFTRKAAGEFLDRIFQRLRAGSAAGDAESGLTAAECAAHLRQLIEKLPRLALGTLDSFFGRMVRAFPFECGLAGEITLMDGHALDLARREALDALFRGQADDAAFAAFLDLIRQQNRNSEGRNVTESLSREIDALHEGFLMTPPDRRWGDPATIWPEGCALLSGNQLPALLTSFETVLFESHGDLTDEFRRHWENLFQDLRALRPGSAVPERAVKFALRALNPPSTSKDPEGFYLTVFGNKRFAFSARERPLAASLGRAILRIEIEGRLARSRALYDLVARFEQPYQELVRQSGRLTFADITGLLAAAEGAVWGGAAARPFDRQQMDFRLDATYDHWLLDEFQDTSRLQWEALRNLVDEVVQSDTGRRSFFYVGDTKQAIYTWRGGDPWLFDEIAEYYNASGTQRIDTGEALDISRRSVPEILETVNTIFDPAHLGRLQAG